MIKFEFDLKLDLEGDEELGFTLFKTEEEDLYVNPEQNLVLTTKPNKSVGVELNLNPKQITRRDLFIMYKPGMKILIRLTEKEWAEGMIKAIQEKTELSPITILLTDVIRITLSNGIVVSSTLGEVAYYLDDTVLEISSNIIDITYVK